MREGESDDEGDDIPPPPFPSFSLLSFQRNGVWVTHNAWRWPGQREGEGGEGEKERRREEEEHARLLPTTH